MTRTRRGRSPAPSPAPPAPRPRPRVNGEIPHDDNAERAALGCVLLAGEAGSTAEQDALLAQLGPRLVYDERHRLILSAMVRLRNDGHAVDTATLFSELNRIQDGGALAAGGVEYLDGLAFATGSWHAFPTHLEAMKLQALRRWALAKRERLAELAGQPDLKPDDLRAEFSDLAEGADKIGTASAPMIELVKPSEARAYVPDPRTFLLGDGLLSRGELTVIAGMPGLGKSRLATTLAIAGALGHPWMGYKLRRPFRTVIVQSENSLVRLKTELEDVPDSLDDSIRISKPTALRFSEPRFRRELRHVLQQIRADLLIIDPWSDVTRDENFADHQDALDNIRDCTGMGDAAPAVVVVAHLRKKRGGDRWVPKTGRDLLDELAGSFALGAKARTVFVLQPASLFQDDDRVVFDCGKSNNAKPNPASAWHRRNGAFTPVQDFDFDAWLNPPDEDGSKKKAITGDVLRRILGGGRAVARKALVEELVAAGYGASTAYRKTDPEGEFAGSLVDRDGLLVWVEG